jgi:hypothetical protein
MVEKFSQKRAQMQRFCTLCIKMQRPVDDWQGRKPRVLQDLRIFQSFRREMIE